MGSVGTPVGNSAPRPLLDVSLLLIASGRLHSQCLSAKLMSYNELSFFCVHICARTAIITPQSMALCPWTVAWGRQGLASFSNGDWLLVWHSSAHWLAQVLFSGWFVQSWRAAAAGSSSTDCMVFRIRFWRFGYGFGGWRRMPQLVGLLSPKPPVLWNPSQNIYTKIKSYRLHSWGGLFSVKRHVYLYEDAVLH